ncbi:MAG: hypothetical protein QM662_17380 [Gordonia sp. (in: high G+C Gram-positive bacteria)]
MMSQDFFDLPGGEVALPRPPAQSFGTLPAPAVDPRATVPLTPPSTSDGGMVVYTRAAWELRAKVARECAEELKGALLELEKVNRNNHYGDTIEGRDFYERVDVWLKSWRGKLRAQFAAAEELAEKCERAAADLEGADSANSHSFEI